MSHPARVAILQALARHGSASPSDAAGAAGVSLGTCSYHMRALMSLGVIRLRSTRAVRGAVEHIYELTTEGDAAVRAIEAVAAQAPEGSRGDVPRQRGRRARTKS
jgi:predicted ArsR family transcriptional regulator